MAIVVNKEARRYVLRRPDPARKGRTIDRTLLPGSNDVPDAELAEFLTNKTVAGWIRTGVLKVLDKAPRAGSDDELLQEIADAGSIDTLKRMLNEVGHRENIRLALVKRYSELNPQPAEAEQPDEGAYV